MAKVTIHNSRDLEKALRTFKRRCRYEGILRQCKERRHYTKPSVKRRQAKIKRKRQNRAEQ